MAADTIQIFQRIVNTLMIDRRADAELALVLTTLTKMAFVHHLVPLVAAIDEVGVHQG